ncbi:DUF4178 domain-containing protein [Carboxylicivirga sp. N1Y90]|uniref:DUF4178 domain-containing protein n=1 Tax=Carboxylicivirga fragile TaxID=3417571 RepID=UPI003D343A8C|nr:DUF4178 domain-containing protein [Marinilabiliaceae bacterium N1Y90]
MGLFDIFKKKEAHYDSTNIRVQDLDVGFVFEYDLSTWIVEAIMEYDWGDNYFTREFQINNGSETRFLGIEDDDELSISFMQKVKVRALQDDLTDILISRQQPPKKITYKGVVYFLEKESPGYFHNITKGGEWEEFRSWDFEDEDGKQLLCIEQWDEKEFEASIGLSLKEFEISNILPGEDNK